ncbi:unnamed protein product [Anisakis simplex]|uniref:DUF4216 domain-containing protein n=1 Tax=Anisakis simplex TaxID=6269 RepID=A0A0M3IZH1_ANISI|nr:unnamed protein product [Anisakis simplex]
MEALNIVPILDDGTVRLRWRIKHVSLLRALMNPMLFKYDYRAKRLKWFDGYSIFTVDGNGLVYRVVTQRWSLMDVSTNGDGRYKQNSNYCAHQENENQFKVMPDEERGLDRKSATQRLAEKIGVLPKGAEATSISSDHNRLSSSAFN